MSDPDSITDLLIRLRADGIAVEELAVQQPTLDEVFLALTGHTATDDDTSATGAESPATASGTTPGATTADGTTTPELETTR
jgi:ABC-2 type transport system ATP-binding protein